VTQVVRVRFVVEPNYAGWRLDRYLQEKIPRLSRERVQHLIEHRLECEGRRLKPSTRVVPGLAFALLKDAEPEPEVPLEFGVVHDDGALLVVDKPAGLPVHPTARYSANTFTSAARLRFPERKVDPAHRLDRETSGLLACGSAPEWTKRLKRAFADGAVSKTYLALAAGQPAEERFTVDAPLAITLASTVRVRMHVWEGEGGLPSVTEFEVLERRAAEDGAPVTLLACRPRTGRQHQIRAHLHHAGLPLVGDKIYGPDEAIFDRFTKHAMTDEDRLRQPRQALHAWRLELPHPRTGERLALEAPLPPDLAGFWASCRA